MIIILSPTWQCLSRGSERTGKCPRPPWCAAVSAPPRQYKKTCQSTIHMQLGFYPPIWPSFLLSELKYHKQIKHYLKHSYTEIKRDTNTYNVAGVKAYFVPIVRDYDNTVPVLLALKTAGKGTLPLSYSPRLPIL